MDTKTTRFKRGDRVCIETQNRRTGEVRRRSGTVQRDEIPFWDYVPVRFDDFPNLTLPVLVWSLFPEGV